MAYRFKGALCTVRGTITGRRVAGFAAAALALALCAGVGGCSSDPAWPVLGKVSDLTGTMTPEERQKAVEELQKNNQNQNGAPPVSQPKPSP